MKKLTPIIIVVMTAALVLSACGGGAAPAPSGGAKPAPTEAPKQPATSATEKPAAAKPTPPPTDTPASGTGNTPDAINLSDVTSGLEALNSYETQFTMTFEGKDDTDQPKSSTMSFTEEYVKNPAAKRTTINGFGAMLGSAAGVTSTAGTDANVMQTIEVGGKQYFQMGTMCTQSTSKDAPQASSQFNPSDLIGGLRGAQLVGTETVNGVPTSHYKSDVTGMAALGYVNAQGEFWVAQPGDFVVKYLFEATGKDKFLGNATNEGTIKWVYEVKNVNQPIDIQAPKDCSGAAEDIPLMADAADQSALGGTTMYTSPSAFKDVVAFYEKEMPAKGWQAKEDGGMSTDNLSMKSYTKDGRTVQVMITGDNDKVSVMITEEKK